MLLYHESGVAYTKGWSWTGNGKYPILSFGKFVFAERFYVSANNVELVEGQDYLRILKSKEVSDRFGVDIFGGIVLLSTDSVDLDVYAVDSTLMQETLPDATSDPYTVATYSSENPMDGSYQNVIDMIDELEALIPYIRGTILPIYVFMKLGVSHPTLNPPAQLAIGFPDIPVVIGYDLEQKEKTGSVRSDFIGGIDNIPLDYYVKTYTTDPHPQIMALPRLGMVPLSTIPIGINYKDTQ